VALARGLAHDYEGSDDGDVTGSEEKKMSRTGPSSLRLRIERTRKAFETKASWAKVAAFIIIVGAAAFALALTF
jgi:hypothetical protein